MTIAFNEIYEKNFPYDFLSIKEYRNNSYNYKYFDISKKNDKVLYTLNYNLHYQPSYLLIQIIAYGNIYNFDIKLNFIYLIIMMLKERKIYLKLM